MENQVYSRDRIISFLIGVAVIAFIFWLLYSLQSVLFPFVLALLAAYLTNPLVNWIQRLIKNRTAAVLVTMLFMVIVTILVLLLLVPTVIRELDRFIQLISAYAQELNLPEEEIRAWIEKIQAQLQSIDYEDVAQQSGVSDALSEALNVLNSLVSNIFGLLGTLLVAVTFLLYFVFILLDYENLTNSWQQYIPVKYRDTIVTLVQDVEQGMNAYFKAQTKIVLIVSIFFAIGFKLIGLPMGIFLGLFVGLLNYVPYLQNVGFIPAGFLAVLHSMESGQSLWLILILVLVVFSVVQLIQDAFLTPKIMGDMTGLNPAIMLLALSVWGYWLGIVGLIIALPITTLMISYYRQIVLQENRVVKQEEE